MPSATKEQPPIPSPKKRRRDDEFDITLNTPLAHASHRGNASLVGINHGSDPNFHHLGLAQARKIIPLPSSKRVRISSDGDTRPQSRSASPTTSRQSKSPLANPSVREELQETNANSRPSPARANSALLLSRCHICHRKPTKKSDLDSFADCQGCAQRTCFVCLRQCLDWRPREEVMSCGGPTKDLAASFRMEDADAETGVTDDGGSKVRSQHDAGKEQHQQEDGWALGGHRPVVCSRCCVEKGPDGDVACLGCLRFSEG